MVVSGHFVSKTAPLAGHGRVLVPLVELDVLHRMAETKFVDACASRDAAPDLNDGQIIDQLLGVCHVSLSRHLSKKTKTIVTSGHNRSWFKLT